MMVSDCLEALEARIALHVVRDGDEAWSFLTTSGTSSDMPTPDLVMMDINLPRRTGFEVLEELKRTPGLLQIPVILLSSSESPQDLARAYALHANAFVHKPFALADLRSTLRALVDFWVRAASYPVRR